GGAHRPASGATSRATRREGAQRLLTEKHTVRPPATSRATRREGAQRLLTEKHTVRLAATSRATRGEGAQRLLTEKHTCDVSAASPSRSCSGERGQRRASSKRQSLSRMAASMRSPRIGPS